MKTTDEILALLRAERPELERQFGVRALALFGSYARGEQRPESDVDILVEVDPNIGLRFVDLADHLEGVIGIRSEVVSRRAIRPAAWDHLQSEMRYVP
jgi:predicted nucleotidyltransferase